MSQVIGPIVGLHASGCLGATVPARPFHGRLRVWPAGPSQNVAVSQFPKNVLECIERLCIMFFLKKAALYAKRRRFPGQRARSGSEIWERKGGKNSRGCGKNKRGCGKKVQNGGKK